jgi:hypothetical protein
MIAWVGRRIANRNALPRWANSAIDYVADHPMSLLGKVAARRIGKPPLGTPATRFEDRHTRVYIAPVNYSGQAWEWARALERQDRTISARSMAVDVLGGFAYRADLAVSPAVYNNDPRWQRREFAAAATATHALVEAEVAPFGRLMGRDVARQVRALTEAGVDVAFMCHGTDIRLPSRNISRTPWSPYLDAELYTARHETIALRNRALLEGLDRPVFVSTPDLLADVNGGIWCPVVVEIDRWSSPHTSPAPGRPLRVAHAPSALAIKGTALIEPALERLQSEGVIEYTRLVSIASADMPARFAEADIVLDQFRLGSYGVAACEAMASGCAVLGHVLPDVRATVKNTTGHDLPIVEATVDTVEGILRRLAGDARALSALRDSGPAFVNEVHDGRLSATTLYDNWLKPRSIGNARAFEHQ